MIQISNNFIAPLIFEQLDMIVEGDARRSGDDVSDGVGGSNRGLLNPENFPREFFVFMVPVVRQIRDMTEPPGPGRLKTVHLGFTGFFPKNHC